MKKTPTIFKRNPDNMREILDEPHKDCAWVFAGEGVPTRKYDGTCCMVKNGVMFKRRELKKGKPQPEKFELVDYDETTGKTVGWMPVTEGKEDRWHVEAFGDGWFIVVAVLPDGQITNHYKTDDWNLFRLPVKDKALYEYDGHTGADVLQRLATI